MAAANKMSEEEYYHKTRISYEITDSIEKFLNHQGSRFEDFKTWIARQEFDDKKRFELSEYISAIETSKWLDIDIRKSIGIQIKALFREYVMKITSKLPEQIVEEYIRKLDKYSSQGPFGHEVYYRYAPTIQPKRHPRDIRRNPCVHTSGHHWLLSADMYSQFAPVPSIVQISCLACTEPTTIKIAELPAHPVWGH